MPTTEEESRVRSDFDVVVVGAGFSGLYMLHRLRELGFSARLYEAGGGVGGTWYWNRYPGARCDIESFFYSYSFSDELQQEWQWSCRYPEQHEILAYLNHVADRFDLRRDIVLNTRVTGGSFDESSCRWLIRTDDGAESTARFLVTAVGCLSAGHMPDYEGLDGFTGQWYHSGAWPHDGVDFSGKRVGVIGTGASGVQCIPLIAESAAHLTVFQRTPTFCIPARNAPIAEEKARQIRSEYPALRRTLAESLFGIPQFSESSAVEATPEERRETYERLWAEGGFGFLLASFNDLLLSEAANDTAADFVRDKIREIVADSETAEKLIPTGYPIGAKRTPLDTNYFETYNRDNVTLVDLRSSPIERITPTGIRTSEGDHDLDVIVFATGYDAMTGALFTMDIRGRGGRTLKEKWDQGPSTYLGISTAGFPNLFTLTGPGSPSVLSNMVVSIEQHVDWAATCLEWLRERDVEYIEAEEQAEQAWTAHVQEIAGFTLYPRATSWYLGANISGKPRVFMPYAGGLVAFRERCDDVAAKDYEGFSKGATSLTGQEGART